MGNKNHTQVLDQAAYAKFAIATDETFRYKTINGTATLAINHPPRSVNPVRGL